MKNKSIAILIFLSLTSLIFIYCKSPEVKHSKDLEVSDKGHKLDTAINKSEMVYNIELNLQEKLQKWYKENYEKQINSDTFKLAEIYSSPNGNSEIVGELKTYYDIVVSNFVLQIVSKNGSVRKEFKEIGDWGYGIHLNVVSFTKDYFQLPVEYLNTNSWINIDQVDGSVSSFVKSVVRLSSVKLSNIETGEKIEVANENYYVESSVNGKFVVRKEIPEDMPCDEFEKTKDIDKIPRYFLEIKEIKKENGDYRIELAYPKGC